jgi:hypothetical protein
MHLPPVDGGMGCRQGLPQHLSTEYLRRAYVTAGTTEQVHFQCFQLQQLYQFSQWGQHGRKA